MACDGCCGNKMPKGGIQAVTIEENNDCTFVKTFNDDNGEFLRIYKGFCSRCNTTSFQDIAIDGVPYTPSGDIKESCDQTKFTIGSYTFPTTMNFSTSGRIYAGIGLRINPIYLNVSADIESISGMSISNDDFGLLLLLNPIINNIISFPIVWVDIPNSILQRARATGGNAANANTITDSDANRGIVINASNIKTNVQSYITINSRYKLKQNSDEIWLSVYTLANSGLYHLTINHKE